MAHVVVAKNYNEVNKIALITTPDGKGLLTFVNGTLVYISDLKEWFDDVFLDKIYNNKTEADIQSALHTITPFKNVGGVYTAQDLLNAAIKSWGDDYTIWKNPADHEEGARPIEDYEILCALYCFAYIFDAESDPVFEVIIDGGVTKLKVLKPTYGSTYTFTFPS